MTDLIVYQREANLSVEEFRDLLIRSTLSERRPIDDWETLSGMLENADVVMTARDQSGQLVGISRALTDFHHCTYLADLAVDRARQRQGIGKELMQQTHIACGVQTRIILLAAPAAETYYPHVGFAQHHSCWTKP